MNGGSGTRGRKRIDDRKTLQGVLFVLYTGIQWEYLPQELRFGSGPTCWRRLAEWQEAGVWEELLRVQHWPTASGSASRRTALAGASPTA
ncbi:hypothetical protein SUDANB51_08090 [Streptomyces sp. enrichment culture]